MYVKRMLSLSALVVAAWATLAIPSAAEAQSGPKFKFRIYYGKKWTVTAASQALAAQDQARWRSKGNRVGPIKHYDTAIQRWYYFEVRSQRTLERTMSVQEARDLRDKYLMQHSQNWIHFQRIQ
jgi:hypothetical protein